MLKRNLVANYLGQAWSAAVGIAFVPLYIKYLGIESYGLIGLFAILQAWLVLLDMGLAPTLSREMARFAGGEHSASSIRDLLRSIEIVAVGIATFMAIGIWLSASWLAEHWLRAERLPIATVAQAFQVMGLVTALRFIENIYRGSLSGLQQQVTLNLVNSLLATVRSAGAVAVIAFLSRTIEAFFFWQAIVSTASIMILLAITYRHIPLGDRRARFSLDALRSVSSYAGGLLGVTLLSLLLTQTDKILLARLLPLSTYGYYSLATVLSSSLFMLIYPIAAAFQPRMVALLSQNEKATLSKTYHLGAQLVSVGAGSVAIVIAFFSYSALRFWTGDDTVATNTASLLTLLTLGNLCNGLVMMPYYLQLTHGWTTLTIKSNIISLIVIIPAIFVFTPRYGAIGAASVWLLMTTAYLVIGPVLMHRRIERHEYRSWALTDVASPLLGATAGALCVKLFQHWVVGIPDFLVLCLAGSLAILGAVMAAPMVRQIVVTTIRGLHVA